MLMEMKKINYGKSSYKDINELISDSAQAHLHIKNQIQKGQYKEKDKEPLANEALDKLQNLWNKSKEQDRSKEEHTLLHEARVAEARMNRLNENLERTGRTVEPTTPTVKKSAKDVGKLSCAPKTKTLTTAKTKLIRKLAAMTEDKQNVKKNISVNSKPDYRYHMDLPLYGTC